MKAIEFIFYLGIISAVFRFLWAFFIAIVVLLKGSTRKGVFETYLLKLFKYFLLVSLIANLSIDYSSGENLSVRLTYIFLGGGILFMYMVSKNEKKQTLINLQQQFGQVFSNLSATYNARLEWLIIILSMTYFTVSIFIPKILTNPVTEWFRTTIEGIYTTPVIGWIFKLIGALFLIQILFKGFNAVRVLLTGSKDGDDDEEDESDRRNGQDNHFDDYEDISDQDDQNLDDKSDKS